MSQRRNNPVFHLMQRMHEDQIVLFRSAWLDTLTLCSVAAVLMALLTV